MSEPPEPPTTDTPETIPDERPQRRREYSGPGSTLGLAVLIVLVVGAAIWWFELRDDSGGGGSADGLGIVALPDQLNPTGKGAVAQEGRAAPNFRLATLDGGTASLTDYRGKWVVLNFWASWCKPCRVETPELQQFARDEAGAGSHVVVLGVNQQESTGAARDFASEFGLSYPVLLDKDGEVSIGYRVGRDLPSTVLVDPAGVVRWIRLGQLSDDDFAQIRAQVAGS